MNSDTDSEDSELDEYDEREWDNESLEDIFCGINGPDTECRDGPKKTRLNVETPIKTTPQKKRRETESIKTVPSPNAELKKNEAEGPFDSILVLSDSDTSSSLPNIERPKVKTLQKQGGKRKISEQKLKKTVKYTKNNDSLLVESDSDSSLSDTERLKAKTIQKQRGKWTISEQKSKKARKFSQKGKAVIKSGVEQKPARKIPFRRNCRGETPLHVACIRGSFERVQQIIEEGCHDVNAKDFAGWTPLHEAANYDRVQIADFLIKHGADINLKCDGQTPLIDAASNGNVLMMKLLIESGADCVSKDKEGHTALDTLLTWNQNQNITDMEFLSNYSEVVGILKRKTRHTGKNGLSSADVQQKEEPSCSYTDVDGTEILPSGSSPREKYSKASCLVEDQYYKTKIDSEEKANRTNYREDESEKTKKHREKKSDNSEGHSEKKSDQSTKPSEVYSKTECESEETKKIIKENINKTDKQIKAEPVKANKVIEGSTMSSEIDKIRKGNISERSDCLVASNECQEDESTGLSRRIVINKIDKEIELKLGKVVIEVPMGYLYDTANSEMEVDNHQGIPDVQKSEEKIVRLNIGGGYFITTAATLSADPNSLFALFKEGCPMRPFNGNTYFFDRDPTHFKYIMYYLRNGAHINSMLLPREARFLLELLIEARFFHLYGLETIVLKRLKQVPGSMKY